MSTLKTKPSKLAAALPGRWAISSRGWATLTHRIRSASDDAFDEAAPVEQPLATKRGGVARINVIGVLTKYASWWDEYLGFTATERIKSAVFDAANDPTIDRLVLVIDSPGGSVDGTQELGELIKAVNETKPVHAAVSDTCCSGALWLASQCESISANPAADVGSIGVYSVLGDDSKFWADMGITWTLVSTGGVKGKGADGQVDQALIEEVQRGVNDIRDQFVNTIAEGRGLSADIVSRLATGQTWRAEEAKSLGLIDAVESVDDAIARITKEVLVTPEQFRAFAADPAHADHVKAITGPAVTQALEAAKPKAASASELKAAFADDPAFVLDRIDVNASMADHKAAYADTLKAKLTASAQESDRLKSELAKHDPSLAGVGAPLATGGEPTTGTASVMQAAMADVNKTRASAR